MYNNCLKGNITLLEYFFNKINILVFIFISANSLLLDGFYGVGRFMAGGPFCGEGPEIPELWGGFVIGFVGFGMVRAGVFGDLELHK